MNQTLKRPRGFSDRLPDETFQLDQIVSHTSKVLKNFDFEKIDLPILEYSDLFIKTLGESSDVVHKEMYSFEQSQEQFTMRPEGTAGVARMFITEKLQRQIPLKFFYCGPMFRHERPQKGRLRQFYQIGAEWLGDDTIRADIEMLSMVYCIAEELKISSKVRLEINSIGSQTDREKYKEELIKYLKPYFSKLSHDSQRRFENNPLRIWDSKVLEDQQIMQKAPVLLECLNQDSLKRYEDIKKELQHLKIPFQENPSLVRGLDYYNDLVFELTSDQLGAQSAALAGGRYDQLISILQGPSTPAVGFAAGLERLSLLCDKYQKQDWLIGILCTQPEAQAKIQTLVYNLRRAGVAVYYRFNGNFSKQMKRIDQKKCSGILIYGEKELAHKDFVLAFKNLKTGHESLIPAKDLESYLKKLKEEL